MTRRASVVSLSLLLALASSAWADVQFQAPGSTMLHSRVASLVELRYKNIVRQAYDLSCGAAALATIFKHYYGHDIGERDIIKGMIEIGDKEKIQKEGFSLLEVKRFTEQQGYVARGYRLQDVKDLEKLKVPAITLVTIRGYAHFVVIKGVAGGSVFLADPAFGNRSRPVGSFASEWNRVILIILSASRDANNLFTLDPTLKGPASGVMRLMDLGVRGTIRGAGDF